MTTIAIVGAGPSRGRSIAARFGAEGFGVALIVRDQAKLERLALDLQGDGPQSQPDAIARAYWDFYSRRGVAKLVYRDEQVSL